MPRVKGGARAHRKHKKIVKLAKGYRGTRSKTYRRAKEAVIRSGEKAFAGRKQRKRDMRKLWITRINAALTNTELNYSRFIKGLKDANIDLNRKTLSEMAVNNPAAFSEVVEQVKKAQ